MFRKFLRSKIHRATVTQADLDYEGSLTIPPDLMRAAAIAPYESVHVWNVTRGTRLETYAITGEEGARDICVNGAAAHLVRPGDVIIIATFAYAVSETSEFAPLEPRVVFVDGENRIQHMGAEVPGPRRRDLPNSSSINSCC